MAFRKWKGAEITGIPPAPLFGEVLGAVHTDWMKIKAGLIKEMPLLTLDELMELLKQEQPPDEIIFAYLAAGGYRTSAEEIVRLIRADNEYRHLTPFNENCQQSLRLEKDGKRLKLLARFFGQCEDLAKEGLWRDIIFMRMRLAKSLLKSGNTWLMEQVVRSCIEYGERLDDTNAIDMNLKAEIELVLAYILVEYQDDERYLVEAIHRLQNCRKFGEAVQTRPIFTYYYTRESDGEVKTTPREMVDIQLELPITLHGWKTTTAIQGRASMYNVENVENTRVLKASAISPFHLASIMWSDIMMKSATKAFFRVGDDDEDEEECSDEALLKTVEELYEQSVVVAFQGQNGTNILNALYSYGSFSLKMGSLERAKKLFLDLHFDALRFNDFETVGVALNGLGHISNAKHNIGDALGNFCNEWELGCEKNCPALVVESTREIGRILLEEGQLVDAEYCCKESFDRHSELKKNEVQLRKLAIEDENDEEYEQDEEDISEEESYDRSWAMAGITAGQSLLGRMAGLARRGDQVENILQWKSNRKALQTVPRPNYRPMSITRAQKYYNVKYLGQQYDDKENIEQEHQVRHMTAQEHLEDWMKLVEEDDYQFVHDADIIEYRERVIAQTESINMSLITALDHEDNLLRKDLAVITSHDARSSYVGRIIQTAKMNEGRIDYPDLSDDDDD